MSKPKHTAEQIISKLREAEVLQSKGMSQLHLTQQTPPVKLPQQNFF